MRIINPAPLSPPEELDLLFVGGVTGVGQGVTYEPFEHCVITVCVGVTDASIPARAGD